MKRIISLMLSLIIILSLVCVAAPSASAASVMKTSDNAVNMIKSFEGFQKYPYEDNRQWSVGYGTGVSGEDLEYYKTYGITELQAVTLLTRYLVSYESRVNQFVDSNGLKLTQQQFDALVSFTYNVGYAWMADTDSVFRSAIINGSKGNDFIFAIAQFGKVNGKIVPGLIQRRLCEANLYLNGVYSTSVPVNYKYVTFEANLEDAVATASIQGYDTTKSTAVKATASKSGYRFLGWYTKAEGGSSVTSLSLSTASTSKLYGHWQKGEGELNKDGSIKGVAAQYSGYAPQGAGQKTYDAPNGKAVGKLKADTKLSVVAEYMDAEGNKWGRLSTGKWVEIGSGLAATPIFEDPESIIDPITVTVTSGGVNNRIGPGTKYATNGKYTKGEELVLTAVQKGGNYTWGKSEKGWIALQYTDYESVKLMGSDEAKQVTAIGTIIKTDVLNVRAGAGVNHAKVGTYKRGDEVKITLRQKVGTTTWGLTEKGWISLYYAKVTEVEEGSVPDIDLSGGNTGNSGTSGDSTGTGSGGTGSSTTVVQTGKIVNCDTLRIRAGAGTGYAHIGNYAKGTYVNIYEITTVRADTWGRTEKGWICLRYVQLDAPTSGEGVTGRVYNCTQVNVRAGAGTQFAKVGSLAKGTKVEILEYTKVGKATWGRTTQGWISLYYVKLDAPITDLDKKDEVSDNTGTGSNAGTGTGDSDCTGGNTGTGTGDNTGTGTGDNTGAETGCGTQGHTWVEATCKAPKTCSVCNLTEGKALDHTWVDATTEAPKTCSVCAATEGERIITDERFTTASTKDLYGKWVASDVISAEELGFEGFTGTLNLQTTMELSNNGTMKVNYTARNEEEFTAALIDYTVDSIYAELSGEGLSKEEIDASVQAAYGMSVREYAEAALADLDFDEMFQTMSITGVYYVENGNLYTGTSWNADMAASKFTVQGNTLTLAEELSGMSENALVFSRAN